VEATVERLVISLSITLSHGKIQGMIRLRIAPSPTGYPHIATIWQALINYAFAKKNKGKFIVRIEDTDRRRFVADAEEKIFEALAWFNLKPDESPRHGGNFGPYRQSERLKVYKKYAEILVAKGFAYYCFCSPTRIAQVRKAMIKKGQIPKYDGYCRRLSLAERKKRSANQEKYVVRLKIPTNQKIVIEDLLRGKIEFDTNLLDDQILIKSDGFPTYHLAVVVDDHLMKISHVVRGEEWLSSTPKHFLLYEYFGWPKPVFVHTPILRQPDRSKLSKRHGHTDISWYQVNGYLPEAILNFLALLGWSHPAGKTVFPLGEFIKFFDLKDLSVVGPVVDLKKLDYLNRVYIRNSEDKKLALALKPFLKFKLEEEKLLKFIPLIKERITRLGEINELLAYFFETPSFQKDLFKGYQVKEELVKVKEGLKRLNRWEAKVIYQTLKQICEEGGYPKKEFYINLYVAIEGKPCGLPLFESMEILGRKTVLLRINQALANF